MHIIGLHNAEDAGVCLLRDGRVLEAVSEERLSRTKLHLGFPELSLQYVLEGNGLTIDEIDFFAYSWYGQQNNFADYARRLAHRVGRAIRRNPDCADILDQRICQEFARDAERRTMFETRMAELGIPSEKIVMLDHHASHAWSAFATSPFARAAVFTFDGRGDLKSTTVSIADRERGPIELDHMLSFDSLGFLYGQITAYLGFRPHRHEGKVTGLAAHGNPSKTLPLFESLIEWDDKGGFFAVLGPYKPFYTDLEPELVAQFDRHRREDLAAGVQAHCENLVTRYVAHWLKQIGDPNPIDVCLAGGICANVRINQCVAELPGVERVFVFPHMGDGGLPHGACCHLWHQLTGQTVPPLDTVYLGSAYSDESIRNALEKHQDALSFALLPDKIDAVVEDLLMERVVGYFDGRMEYGPRALGNRSILFHTRDASVNDWLNSRLRRTEFMPFAPVTPHELAASCYDGWRPNDPCGPFMTRTYHCTPSFAKQHPAVVHVDGTARPQVITADANPDYYRIVSRYCDRTGERALINTSFNQHEEPIVCTPEDAIGSLLRRNVDVLVIGNWRATLAAD